MDGETRAQGLPPLPRKKSHQHTQKHSHSSVPVPARGPFAEPAMGLQPDPDEAKTSTVEAAFHLFRQNCPDFSDQDLKSSLGACWTFDVNVQTVLLSLA